MSSQLFPDFFAHAVELTHTQIPGVTQQQRLQAEQYLMALRTTGDGLNLALRIISYEQPMQDLHCFWAFNTVMHHFSSLACSLNDVQAEELYRTLFSFIHRHFFLSPGNSTVLSTAVSTLTTNGVQRQRMEFLANKHAQVMIAGLQVFFPTRWCSFFDDAFELLACGNREPDTRENITVYLLRLFECIDERIVSTHMRDDREREQRARDMEIKDVMRLRVIPRAVAMWYATLCQCRTHAPEIANICLGVVQTYIEWVDVSFFLTSDWINLLYFFLTIPTVRKGACECIRCLVEKKQLPEAKMQSLRTVNIVEALPRIVDILQVPMETDDDVYFLEVVARLVGAVAEEFLSLYEHLNAASAAAGGRGGGGGDGEDRIRSSGNKNIRIVNTNANMGSSSHDEKGDMRWKEQLKDNIMAHEDLSVDNVHVVHAALDNIVGQLLRLLRVESDYVSDTLLPFIQRFLKSTALHEEQAVQLLLAIYNLTKIRGLVQDEDLIWVDDIIDRRKQLHNLLRLIFRRYPSVMMQHLHATICSAATGEGGPCCYAASNSLRGEKSERQQPSPLLSSSSVAAATVEHRMGGVGGSSGDEQEEVEAALRYLYEVGESIRMEDMRNSTNGFAQLVCFVLSSERIAQCSCSAVHLSYFEVLDRYYAFFVYHKEYIPLLLHRLLLQPHGIMNRHPRVRARVCYLFGHLVQLLKHNLTPHAQDIVNAVQTVFAAGVLLPSDRRELYEATGNILSAIQPPLTGGIDSSTIIMQVIHEVTQNLCDVTSAAFINTNTSGSYPVMENSDQACADAVADGISFLSALAKGLRSSSSNSSGGGGVSGGNVSTSSNVVSATVAIGSSSNDCDSSVIPATTAAQINGNNFGCGIPADTIVAEIFHGITRDVMNVLNTWRMSPLVRDRTAQYFMQMVQTLPFESIEVYITTYISSWLLWMDSVQELTKLLRLLFHLVNRSGSRISSVLTCTMPLVLQKAAAIGNLSISPEEMGVVSESTREKRDVYRQLFGLLQGATNAGCAEAILSVPPDNLATLLTQLLAAMHLAKETELTKLALQVMTGITSASTALRHGQENGTGSNNSEGVSYGGGGGCDTSVNNDWTLFMLRDVVPAVLQRFLSPGFDAMDAKSVLLVGDAGLLLRALMHRLGPSDASSLSGVLYDTLQPLVGAEEVAGLVAALQESSRLSAETKIRFRNLLVVARERRAAGGVLDG